MIYSQSPSSVFTKNEFFEKKQNKDKMKTIMFVEKIEDSGKMIVGFQLDKFNYRNSPPGIIRVARFEVSFCPLQNKGYYSEVYIKKMIKTWKIKNQKKEFRNVMILKNLLCNEMICEILKYI